MTISALVPRLTRRTPSALAGACGLLLAACSDPAAMAGTDGGADLSSYNGYFSFFVTSLRAMQDLSRSPAGFGGDLRYGETGAGAGLRGADKICAAIAERSQAGAGSKPWRAFLSAVSGADGRQVDAIDRVGEGPWYDRLGRLVAKNKADLNHPRPLGAAPVILNDLPNEDGVPNHQPDLGQAPVDNHDILTGTGPTGRLHGPMSTCQDWTSARGDRATEGRPRVGHSWPRMGEAGGPPEQDNWMSWLDEAGCAPGVSLIEMGPPKPDETTVGSGGGYGGIYCLSLIK